MKYINKSEQERLQKYEIYEYLFMNEHVKAFDLLYPDKRINQEYQEMTYVACNLASMLSELSADMLFEEFPTIRIEGDTDGWLSKLYTTNKLKQQFYESAMETSYRGDAVFKIRSRDGQLIIEDVNPMYYFPVYNPQNVREEPTEHRFMYPTVIDYNGEERDAVHIEIHQKGLIINELWLLEGNELKTKLDWNTYIPETEEIIETGIEEFLVVHIRNYRVNSQYYGISDYKDIRDILFAINNRVTRINDILDEHGNPILLVPPGMMDKKDQEGNVKNIPRKYVRTVSYKNQNGQKPEYIVWDAKLEVTFSYIERLMELFYMITGTNSAAFGLDKAGFAESGRALKFKLLRTIAKKHKKQLYFDPGIKQLLYVAQQFAKANNLLVGDKRVNFEPVIPNIKWEDGLINDMMETVEIETLKLSSGLTSKVDAIQSIDNITEDEAQEKYDKIKEEKEDSMPQFTANPAFQNQPGNQPPITNEEQ